MQRQFLRQQQQLGIDFEIGLTFPSPGCRWVRPRSCSCTWWRAPSRPSSQAGTPETPNPPNRHQWLCRPPRLAGNTIGGRVKFSATPFWGPATLFPPRSTSKTHFRIVDSSRLNPSRVDVLLRGRWLHWAPGGRSSRRRRRAGAPAAAAAVFDPGRVRGAGGTERPPAPLAAGAHQLSHPTLMRGNGIWSWLPTNWHQLEKLNAFAPI